MSANDLRGLDARVDRSQETQEPKVESSRRHWIATLAVLPLLAMPILWLGQDPADRAATLQAVAVVDAPGDAIPLHVNARVERWLNAFQTTRREEFEHLLERRELFSQMIRDKLRERGMPEDLIYLAMIESGMSPFAVSRVSAVGLWQFMSPTALQYGLRVDEYVDERRDPVRATDAALDYLQWLHGRFDSWYLAAAAFNAGPGRVERILNRHADGRIGDEDIYWQVLEYLPRETREYIPKLVAVTILAKDADALGFAARMQPYRYDNVFVPGGTPLSAVAQMLGADPSILADLNPHLTRGITPPGEIYGVRVPVGESAVVVASMALKMAARRADD
jgi:membrane-bound lytic murein transglycosylase D